KIKRFQMARKRQRLTNDHAAGFTSKVLVHRLAVDNYVARPFFQEHASHRSLAAAGSVIPITDHDLSLDFQRFGLLSGVWMLGASINLEFLGHGVTQGALGQHTLDGLLKRTTGETLLHFLEGGLGNTTGVARVTIVALVLRLITGNDDVGSVDNDEVIAGVYVRRELGLVLAPQTACDFAGHTTK